MRRKRTLFLGLIWALTGFLTSCISPRSSDQTEVKILLNTEELLSASDLHQSKQVVVGKELKIYLMLKVTAPELDTPLTYFNLDYQPDQDWTILVPNGKKRTFEVLMYMAFPYSYQDFPAYFYRPANPPSLRTYDLVGTPIVIEMPLEEPISGVIGSDTANSQGLLQMELPSGTTEPLFTSCSYASTSTESFYLEIYFRDLEFNNLRLGPSIYAFPVSPAPTPGAYTIYNVPFGRTYVIEVEHKALGWYGASAPFVLPADTSGTPYPVDVIIRGFKPLNLGKTDPPALLVKNGDTVAEYPFQIKAGWGAYSFSSAFLSSGDASIFPIMPERAKYAYYPNTTLMADNVDNILITDLCDGSTLTIQAYWYLAPKIDPMPMGVDPPVLSTRPGCYPLQVYVYGSGFDMNNALVLIDGSSAGITNLNRMDYVIDFELASPKSEGYHKLKVINPRSNPLFPDFKGFSDQVDILFEDTVCSPPM